MKINGLIISICGTILFLSSPTCSKLENQRYVSNPIACASSNECFSIVDSLLNGKSDTESIWSELPKADSLINFHDYSYLNSNATILVKDFIEVHEASNYLIRLGSDDGIRVFLNKEEIYRNIIGRSLKPDSDWIQLPLKAGLNEIIYQVNQRDGGWGLYYKIEEKAIKEELLKEHIASIYRDLPNACIIEEVSGNFALNIDPRVQLDTFHSVHFQWVDPILEKVIWSESYNSSQLPNTIGYPEGQISPLVLEYYVVNQSDTVYVEQIPIFEQQFIDINIKELVTDSDLGVKWKEGLFSIFERELDQESKRSFSSRFKAEFLWDAINEVGLMNYRISGARTVLFNGELAKNYIPYKNTEHQILGIHVEFSDSVIQYFDTYAGRSHSLMTEWNSYSQYYQADIHFPFIKEQDPVLNTESTIRKFSTSFVNAYSIIGWSKGTATIFSSLENNSFKISDIGIISPWVLNTIPI
jgi:hypothetical protein